MTPLEYLADLSSQMRNDRLDEFDEIMKYSDHIIFNSFSQWKKFRDKVKNNISIIA